MIEYPAETAILETGKKVPQPLFLISGTLRMQKRIMNNHQLSSIKESASSALTTKLNHNVMGHI
jgi:hypothetical protein